MICKANDELESARAILAGDLNEVLCLRPMPQLALRISQACQNQELNLKELIELVECEPKIASRILSVVNSPIFGSSREITSLNQAVVVMGFKRLSEMTISIASKQVFDQKSLAGSNAEDKAVATARKQLYEHCLACATTARVMAKQSNSIDAGSAFLTGMLHDIGKLFFFDLAPITFLTIHPPTENKSSVEQELELFGVSHAQLGMNFAAGSGLPATIHTAIAGHHGCEEQSASGLAQHIGLANALAKAWGIGNYSADDYSPCEIASTWLAETEPETADQLCESVNEQFQELRALFMD